jgi:hypothetical protein
VVGEELRAVVMIATLEGWDPPRYSREFYRPGLFLESLSRECWALTKEDMIELRSVHEASFTDIGRRLTPFAML